MEKDPSENGDVGEIVTKVENPLKSKEEVLQATQKILDEIMIDTLVGVFAEGEGTLRWIIENNGVYYRRGS